MAHLLLRQQAIKLREQGKTYSEIRRELKVAKSTLSDWLTNYPLTSIQLTLLNKSISKNRDLAREKYRVTMRLRREARLKKTYKEQRNKLLPLSKRELLIAGLFLYWGEGDKYMKGAVGVSNSNPKIIKFALFWLIKILRVPREKIRIKLHLYNDMDIVNEIKYWRDYLKVPNSQFVNPYIKNSTRTGLTYKSFGHGTCNLLVLDTSLKERVMIGIEAIADFYCPRI
jgi:transposase-like protein